MRNEFDIDEVFICDCRDLTHIMRFSYIDWCEINDEKDFYVSFLKDSDYSFWRRLWQAIRHTFKRDDLLESCLCLPEKDIPRMIEALRKAEDLMRNPKAIYDAGVAKRN